MNVLHVISTMDPSTGGPPAVAARLAAAQSMLDDISSVTILSHEAPGRSEQIAASLRGIPNIDRVRFETIPAKLLMRFALPRESRLHVSTLVKKSDVVHLHGVWDPILLSVSQQARRHEVPYVITAHGMLDPWSLRQSALKKKIALAVAYRRMLQHAASFHVLNADEAALMEPLRLRPSKTVIPNGVFLEEIEPLPTRGTFHAMHPELRGQPYVLFLSRLHYKKGLDYLADAFAIVAKKIPSLRLVTAGPDGGAQPDFEQRIARSNLTDRVHIVGPIYGKEKFAAIVDAACFCLPSRQEGFSMAITESIACGTPVVISRECHFPEVETAGAGEVVVLDPDKIAAAIERVVSDDARRRAMGEAGRALVRERFTWPAISAQTLSMYRRALQPTHTSEAAQ